MATEQKYPSGVTIETWETGPAAKAEDTILDGWLKEFDAKQAAFDERQDAFFRKMGIKAVAPARASEERTVGAGIKTEVEFS